MRGASRQTKIACFVFLSFAGLVVLAKSLNPIPSRTRPLNSSAPMVLWLKPWESRSLPGLPRTRNLPLSMFETKTPLRETEAAFLFLRSSSRAAPSEDPASADPSRSWPLASRVGIDHGHPDAFSRAHRHRAGGSKSDSRSSPDSTMGVLSCTFVISAFFRLHNEQSQVVSSLISDTSLNVTAPQWPAP